MRTKSTSFQANPYHQNKISYQTKLKIRGTNETVQQSLSEQRKHSENELIKVGSSQPMRYMKSFSCYEPHNSQLNQSLNLIERMNSGHHNSQQCLCNQCLCGRHFCKLHVVKPDLGKSTVYQKSFRKGKTIKNNRIQQNKQIYSLPKVQMSSTYSFTFRNKQPQKMIKHHPDDLLKFEGPSQKLTSYQTNFPGNRGSNPYIPPKEVYARGQFSYRNKRSSYRESFNQFTDFKITESGKNNDQLKTGYKNLFRESFYQQKFKQPNPEDYSINEKNIQKLQIDPNFPRQYETSYGKEFVQIQSTICPSKIKLETQYKDFLTNKKQNFIENSDFKSFSSTFHALSTAPYGQYQ